MAIKKRNITSINWTDKNVLFFQRLGYMNRKKQVDPKHNLSEFVNRCVDKMIAIEWPELDEELDLKLLLAKMRDLETKRDNFNKDIERCMKEVAIAITKVKEQQRAETPQSVEIEVTEEIQVLAVGSYESPIDTHM